MLRIGVPPKYGFHYASHEKQHQARLSRVSNDIIVNPYVSLQMSPFHLPSACNLLSLKSHVLCHARIRPQHLMILICYLIIVVHSLPKYNNHYKRHGCEVSLFCCSSTVWVLNRCFQGILGPLFFVCDALVEGKRGSFMSMIVHYVHNNIVPHIATPCYLF